MSTDQITSALHAVLPVLRSVDIPREPLRIVQPLTAVKPRPTPPARPLTATPLGHDLPDYEVTTAPKTTAKRKAVAEYAPPGPLIGRELIFHDHVYGPGAA